MDADFAHCEALVRSADKDRFIATLFAPAAHRPGLYALYAFALEIGRVPAAVTQPLAGEVRLQWWSEAVEGERAQEAGANPVASALLATKARYSLPAALLLDVPDGVRPILYGEDDAESHARALAAVVALAMRILMDGDDPATDDLARDAGLALAAANPDDALRHLAAAGARFASAPPEIWPALLPLALVKPLAEGRALPQWRRQWLIWRAARRPGRIFG